MPRKYRRRNHEIHSYTSDWKENDFVIVTSTTTFKGEAIGVILGPQKWCEYGIPVYCSHPTMKNICILPNRDGDTVRKATKKKE